MAKLEKEAIDYARERLSNDDYPFYNDEYELMLAFEAGAEWRQSNLWHPADGDYLPEYEREVVVFIQDFPETADMMRVAIAHRPNPNGWDGKSITTGKVEHYTPKNYDKGGWNIPDVKIWLDCDLPKTEE